MIIKTTKKLNTLCTKLESARFITVDTEFIREKTYYPQLCLIQVGTNKKAWIIDALAKNLDLTAFFDILKNKKIIKVFHACRQDIEIFYHLMHQMPTPIFDTQIGAMVCGYGDNVSYQQLVKDYVGIELDKGMRITDWSHRPLNKDQEKYALHDVIELQDIYQKMMDEICGTNRLDWIQEEMQHLTSSNLYEPDIVHIMTKMRVPFKKKENIHLCARLCEWREKMAQEKDRPRKYILTDEAILEIAASSPKNAEELEVLRTISNGFSKSDLGKSLLEVLDLVIKEEPIEWHLPEKINLTPTQKNCMEALKLLLNVVSEQERVAPYLVATSDNLAHYAKGQENVPFMKGWRHQLFGQKVKKLMDGKLAFFYDPDQHTLVVRPV